MTYTIRYFKGGQEDKRTSGRRTFQEAEEQAVTTFNRDAANEGWDHVRISRDTDDKVIFAHPRLLQAG